MAEANTSGAQQAQDAQNFDNQNSLSQPGSDAGASPGGRVGGSDGPAPANNPGTPDSPAMYSQTTTPGGVEQGGQGGPSNNDAGANGSGGSNAGRPQGSQTNSGNNGWTFSVNANSTGNQGNGQGDGAGAGGGDSGSGASGSGSGGSGQGSAPQFNGVPGGGRGGSGGGGSSSGSGGSSNSGSTYTASAGGGDGPSQTGGNSSAGDGGGNQGDASGAGNSGSGSGASGNSGSASGNSSSGSTNSQSGTTGSNSGASGTGSSGTNNASSTGSSTGSSSTSSSTSSSSSSNSSSSSVASSATTNSTGGQSDADPYVLADLLNTSSGGVSLGGGAPKLAASAISTVTELSGATNSSTASVSGAVVTLKLFDANPNPSDTITITLASNPFSWSHGDLPATAAAQLAAALDLDNPSAQVFAVDSVTVSDAVDPVSGAIGKDITTALLFQVPDKTFDFLALGERLTINFQIVATETATGVAAPPQDFSIFVTGTNDVPVISAVQHTGATDAETLTKVIANGHLAHVTDEASGTLTFTDVDLTDTHTVQIADPVVSLSPGAASLPADVASALKSALTIKMLDSTGVDVGTLNWSFSLDNTKLAFLTKNQTMKLVYDVTVTDSTHGVSVAHPVTLTILGASDDAVVTLSATPTVTQGAGIVYTADIGQNPTLSPIIVKLDNEYSITIPVGSTHASITVDAPTDVTSGAPVLETVHIAGLVGDGGFGKLTADTHAVTTLVTQVDDTPVVTIHAASSLNLTEGGFSAGQALFDYTVSADTDGSTMSEVVSDNIAGVHQAYFELSEGQVVLTTAGATYFNSHEAADLQLVQVTVTATDDAGEGGNESQSAATTSLGADEVSIASEAAPTVTVQAIAQGGLVEGGFSAGQALFNYTVSADTDGSTQTLSVSDNVAGTHSAYFSLDQGHVVLTAAGAAYFNSHEASDLQSVQVTVTATDDAGDGGNESQSAATTSLGADEVSIASEAAPTVTVQAIAQSGLTEGGFTTGQALFNYTVSADTDGSTQTLSVSDNVAGSHSAYFTLDQGHVVLTAAGAAYFNSHEASDLQSVQVTVTATDDAGEGGNESQASATTSLGAGEVAIAHEAAPTVTVQAITPNGLVEGGFTAGQALFNYMVSPDSDGSTVSTVVSDNVAGTHPAYFALQGGRVVLTTAGAAYFNSHEAADLQSVQVTVTATDDAGEGSNESQASATTSLAAGEVAIAHEAAPTVTVQAIAQSGLVEGGFSAGQALFNYTVSADTDGSIQTLSVSDNVVGTHSAYFTLDQGHVVLTAAGAAYFNSHEASDLQSVQVTVTATDDAGEGGNESQSTAMTSLGADEVSIASEAAPTVTVQAIAQSGLVEGGFSAGQALFNYTVSADTDGSTMSEVVSDNIAGVHQAYFALSEGQVVLTTAGARYFNSHEAADLQSVQVTVTVTDDAGEGGNESQASATTSLGADEVSIASEAAPTVTVQAIAQGGLVEGGFSAGQALFNYTVSADTDGSTQTLSVSDNVAGTHSAYFTLDQGHVVLTAAGAAYFNSHEASDLQSVQVTVTATDDAGEGGNESQASATTSLAAGEVTIAHEAAPTVTVQAITPNGLVEGGFTAGQALFNYMVSPDSDGSTVSTVVSDNVAGTHPAYFALQGGRVVLTTAGAAYFNRHEAADLQSVQVTVTATDDVGEGGSESQASATTSLAAGEVTIAHEAAPTVTVQAIAQGGLVEGGFSAGQALFNYTVSADTDGSTQTVSVSDNVVGTHSAYFTLDQGHVVLTAAGAAYFNSHEASDLQSVQVTVTATDDAGEGGNESQSTAMTSLGAGEVTIAHEAAPTVTVQAIAQSGLVEGGFSAGQALFTYSVSADTDGSTMSTVVRDNIAGTHPEYFSLHDGQIVLTSMGAAYFNSQEASDLLSIQVSVIAIDDGGTHDEVHGSDSATLGAGGVRIAPEPAPTVTLQAIAQSGLREGAFSAGQALFSYSVSADADGSQMSYSVSDNIVGTHQQYFALDHGQVVLTTAGAAYFNGHEAADLQAVQVTVTATDDAGEGGNESQASATTSLAAGEVTIAHEAAPTVTVQAIAQGGLVEGGFSAGQALFNYTVSADTDGSTQTLSVSDNVAGTHSAYFTLDQGHVVLTAAGAAYFNRHEAADLQSVQVTVTATDDAGEGGNESQASATTSLAAGEVPIAHEAAPTVTVQAIAQGGLVEGGFSAGQALFNYMVSPDSDGSTVSTVVSDNVAGTHPAYFALQGGRVVLTTAGAAYFNRHEAADLRSVQVTVTATDDAGEGGHESQASATTSLGADEVSIAHEAAPTVTVQAIAQSGLVEGGFSAGQALFNYTVSADTDGSIQTLSVSDNVVGTHSAYFTLDQGHVVLTAAGAAYFNSHEAADLRSVQVTVTATDDAGDGGNESQASATTSLAAGEVTIAHEAAPTVTVLPIVLSGLVEGGFTAGLALFTYSVSADTDGSSITVVVNDDIAGTHEPLYALQENQVVLTTAGAAYFNSHEAADLQSLLVSVSAVDDVNGGHAESYTTTTVSLAGLTIAAEAAPVVELHAVGNLHLVEGGFTTGQALFNYTVSADTDGSTQTLSVSDDVAGQHSAYFGIRGSQIVLTAAGASYFNSHEAPDLQSITVSLTATDDAGASHESQGSASASLQGVAIAHEPAPVVTVSAIQQSGLVEEGFTLNQALFDYTVSGDRDGSTVSLAVADNIAGEHPAYFALQQGQVVLTEAGVAYFNTLEAAAIQAVQVTVTATDDATPSAESTRSASASLAAIAVAHEAAPSVTIESASHDGFMAGSFATGQAILNYAVSDDADGSVIVVTVTGLNAGLFSVDAQNHQILLTAAGANRFNSSGISAIEALSFSITARDDVSEPSESFTTVTRTLAAAGVVINIDTPPSLTMSAIAQSGLSEGHFTPGQALFAYVLGHDADNSVMTLSVDDNIVALHSPYFALQGTDVVLTAAGAAYFNTQEAADLQAIEVSVIATDEAGSHPESQTSATANLSLIAIAAEPAATVSVTPIAHPSFQEGAFTTGMALFDYSVSADADGSTVGVAVSDNVVGTHPAYFALQSGQVVLTEAGATYFNSHEASALQAIQVTVTATDDAGAPNEAQGSAHSTLHGVTISPEAAPAVALAAIPSSTLIEGDFTAGQALYSYTVSADHDGSTISLSVSDNAPAGEAGPHDAYFTLDSGQVILTSAGADYFNTHDGTILEALRVTVSATDDAGQHDESTGSATTSLAADSVAIGAETPVTVTLQSIDQQGLQEGAFSAGQALFSYSVSADSDASVISLRVEGDDQSTYHVASQEAPITVHDMFSIDALYQVLTLTTLGAEYFNSVEGSTIQALTVDLIAIDDAGNPSPFESESVGRADLSNVSIAYEDPQPVNLQPIAASLYEGKFTTGEAIFSFHADSDASRLDFSVSGVDGQSFYYWQTDSDITATDMFNVDALHNTLVLTDVGAQFLNSQEASVIQSLQVSLTVTDWETDSYAIQSSATASLADTPVLNDGEQLQITAQAIDGYALIQGEFVEGQALFHYSVSDPDGSYISVSTTADSAAYFSVDTESQNVVLTKAGADYFNTHEIADIRSMVFGLVASDDPVGDSAETGTEAHWMIGDVLGTISANENVRIDLIHVEGVLKEDAFTVGQAIFAYSLSDADGSTDLVLSITGPNADFFSVDARNNTVVLTERGTSYFNSHEAAEIYSLQLGLATSEDDSSSLGYITLGSAIVIAPEDPPTVTTQYVTPTPGRYQAGQTLYTFDVVVVDPDGGRIDVSVTDNVVGGHAPYFAVSGGNIVLTEAGAVYMTNTSPALLSYVTVGLIVTDDGGEASTRLSLPALGPGGGNIGPVALDLNGDGIQYVGLNAGVHYDYAGAGAPVDTAWVAPQDGVLGYKVAGGATQVVFSTTAGQTDLQGLEQVYDANHDGVLNVSDPTFANFGVVQIAGAGATPTFTTLASLGVTSISLTSSGQAATAANGDVLIYGQTTYTLADGTKLAAADVSFATTPIDSSVTATAPAIPAATATTTTLHLSAVTVTSVATAHLTAVTATTEAVTAAMAVHAATSGSVIDAHAVAAAIPSDAQPSTADGHAQAPVDTIPIEFTGQAYHVTLNLPSASASAALDAMLVVADSGSSSIAMSGSSWVDVLTSSDAQAASFPGIQSDPHAATTAADGTAHPSDWIAVINTATADGHDAAPATSTNDTNPLVTMPPIPPADPALHDATTVALNPWHA